ncbi:hypothetical protein IV203_027116 [Nitzschia inconspicua]|uniref:Uncharacterized protein n=1 Tax=Nitzschia inconspicua TaxID=303405 RepID=A0A9K3LJW4_9STRA|nr:hypothetical protein IV203_027116 [Nitzschia inconspicua]
MCTLTSIMLEKGGSLILAHEVNRLKRACSQALKTCYSSTPGSVQGGSKRSGGCDLDSRSGHRSGYQTASTFSMGGSYDSVKSGSTASFADELLNEDETAMGGHVDEKMLNLELLKICLECGIPMN